MRVNVYGEELTSRIEVVTKEVVEEETGDVLTFYGVRFWLRFPNQPWWVHRKVDGEEDDDSSALTVWSDSLEALTTMFQDALVKVNDRRAAEWLGEVDG